MKIITIVLAGSVSVAVQIHAASPDGWMTAEPEYPRESGAVRDGWVESSGIYEVPPGATQARVELHLLWAPNGSVHWSDVEFLPTEAPAPRIVRLASVHYRPRESLHWVPHEFRTEHEFPVWKAGSVTNRKDHRPPRQVGRRPFLLPG